MYVIASGIAAAVVVILFFLWWRGQSDNEDASQVAPINGETTKIGIPKSSPNLNSQKSALLDDQRKPVKAVLPGDNVSPVELDNTMQAGEPIPKESQNEAVRNQYDDNPNSMLSKQDVEKQFSSEQIKEEKLQRPSDKRGKSSREAPALVGKQFPLDMPGQKGE